jgi:hypothetical protein
MAGWEWGANLRDDVFKVWPADEHKRTFTVSNL